MWFIGKLASTICLGVSFFRDHIGMQMKLWTPHVKHTQCMVPNMCKWRILKHRGFGLDGDGV